MKLEEKRIFISDLPETASKDEIEAKFQKYGTVKSIEIKERKELGAKNSSLFFSYVNIEIDDYNLQKCFKEFGNNKWHGSFVQLQIARESFLDRLKRERESNQTQNADSGIQKQVNGLNGNFDNLNETKQFTVNEKVLRNNNKIEEKIKIIDDSKIQKTVKKQEQTSDSSSSSESESEKEEEFKLKIINNKGKSLENGLKIESFGKPIIEINTSKKVPLQSSSQSDLKRIESLNRMKNNYQAQKLAIQSALTNIDIKRSKTKDGTGKPKKRLFDEESDDDMTTDFKLKKQYEGKSGHKLLQLQSRYKNDQRFKLDSRFLEDDENADDENQEWDMIEEKKKQYEILEQVLGRKVNVSGRERKRMLRFDPSQPEHSKYEIQKSESSKKNKKRQRYTENEESAKPPEVSKEVFYKVTENLKDTFQESQSFSLLSKFGKEADHEREQSDLNGEKYLKRNMTASELNPFKYDSSEEETEQSNDKNKKTVQKSSGKLWQESFFFKTDDYRLQEGFEFVERMKVTETTEFSQLRRDLKYIVKSKVKNNLKKNTPFKKKLGGNKRRKNLRIKKALKR